MQAENSGPPMSNRQAILAVLNYYNGQPPVGAVIRMADRDQTYRKVGTTAKPREGKPDLVLTQWETHCAICNAPFVALTSWYFDGMTRVCRDHAKDYRKAFLAKREQGKAARAAPKIRLGKTERHVLGVVESLAMASDSVTEANVIEAAIVALPKDPASKRDVRRQVVQRAFNSLAKRGNAPLVISGGVVSLAD